MHRQILRADNGLEVDHKDGDGLNNTHCNLRLCSHAENMHNRLKQEHSSRYKGVRWDVAHRKWRSEIKISYKKIYLGYHLSETEAALAYDEAAIKYHGQFARLNFA
jgi:hypothetical protein